MLVSEAEHGLEELEVRVWGRVFEMAEAPLWEEAGRHRQQCMERQQMPLLLEELEEAGCDRVQGTSPLRSPQRLWIC